MAQQEAPRNREGRAQQNQRRKQTKPIGYDAVLSEMLDHHVLIERMAKRATTVSIVSIALSFMLAILAWIGFSNPPETRYFLADAQGRIISLTPVNEPLGDTERLGNWFTQAITKSFTLDFANYKKQVASVRQYYTNDGYNNLILAMKNSGLIDVVKERRTLISAVPVDAPIIVKEGEQSGVYYYLIRQNIKLTFYIAGKAPKTLNYKVDSMVIRVSPDVSPYGVLINQLIMKQGGSGE